VPLDYEIFFENFLIVHQLHESSWVLDHVWVLIDEELNNSLHKMLDSNFTIESD